MNSLKTVVLGTGSYLPERVVTNDDLSKIVETSDEWIVQRTGIRERHIAAEGETTGDLAVAAAMQAMEAAGVTAADIDLVILATSTPDNTFPSTATQVQARLGITRGAAFDLQAVCSGFVYALTTADSMLQTGVATRALVIGSETFSRIVDWTDRTTCVLFGDGAGAFVVEARADADNPEGRGVVSCHLRSDGRHKDKLYVDGGPSSTGTVGHLRMEGREVYKFAVAAVTDVIEDAFAATGESAETIDWFVPHQANRRIIEGSARKLGIAPEKTVLTVDRHGNTSAASIPLAVDTAVRDGRIREGHMVLLEAMGGGFTWGAVLVRW
ncbi:beta-ketoacyl-ACP synthase III [Methylobrevis pamukkalensis]|uniref:Beta-ketoacyl-[acyl-carrier-protein] synthase III n=1 Tax=Methylobrevis pamukkalensis TaxID=1439726 RepID=A0A1E3H760_9HYPH|nr:beta-ketoacyl-ACP synthase III [Methylobrevis pamukkalensis]ODN71341.1 3-oxoacyl-[acyl-carrier-protein] synthase 3 protein 1 [Methylobrevis pamukkalensis]